MWKGSETDLPVNDQNLLPLMSYDYSDYRTPIRNYGTVFSDFDSDGDVDLYIAKCRQFVSDPQDPRRINQLWVNDGQGGWTEEAADRGLVFFEQSWTADFGDIDNDGDMDLAVTNHSTTLFLLENDGTGHYTDITAGSGMEVSGLFPTSSRTSTTTASSTSSPPETIAPTITQGQRRRRSSNSTGRSATATPCSASPRVTWAATTR